MDMYFVVPPIDAFYRSKPVRYLSHLIGHESDGSILSLLKSMGWANGLYASEYQSITEFGFMNICIELTDAGVQHVDDVVAVVFAYIEMLRRDGAQEWICREVQSIMDMNFRLIIFCFHL